MSAVSLGGSLVYSTCTLSPAQNEAIIQLALSKQNSDPANISETLFRLVDLTDWANLLASALPSLPANSSSPSVSAGSSLTGLRLMTIHADGSRRPVPRSESVSSADSTDPAVGILLLPSVAANFGPTFIAKMQRIR
ncbi:unnamed protein product [Protopolystoma xenopodis]|uniref:NOL1/NOP2/Sun domain family member 4 n=1 Tax=Protopolystoma xenopodis TaxID=117903 RepID=A0A448WIL9_9PLAT|nr:unnamed protein product [Protopolystoma xenopodis]